MAEIRFYHLQKTAEETAVAQIAAKALASGKRVLIRAADAVQAEALNGALWTFKADSFVPHGTAKDGNEDRQPVFIGVTNDNPNGAKIFILTAACVEEPMDGFDLRCEMLNEDNKLAARERWKTYKAAGHTVTYWLETAEGGWVKQG